MKDFEDLIKTCYGENACILVEGGVLFFSPDSLKEVAGAEHLSYDEYLDIQIRSLGTYRSSFESCYLNTPIQFRGQIEKITKKHICFKRIYVSGMYPDGLTFKGKEDHVWMDLSGFESFRTGDCAEFYAEVYRYLKTGSGKQIDYALRNPEDIRKIDAYALPSDDDLIRQEVDQMICETCLFRAHCNGVFCLRNPEERAALQKQLFDAIKGNHG